MSMGSGKTKVRGKKAHATKRPPANLIVRLAGKTDETPLSFFFDTLLRNDYFMRRGQLRDILRSDYHRVWVAEIDDVLVGVAITTRGSRLINVLVHPAYRGLGIGRALVCGSGAREVRAKVDMSTGDPRAFYRALGFVARGRTAGKEHIELMQQPKSSRGGGAAQRSA